MRLAGNLLIDHCQIGDPEIVCPPPLQCNFVFGAGDPLPGFQQVVVADTTFGSSVSPEQLWANGAWPEIRGSCRLVTSTQSIPIGQVLSTVGPASGNVHIDWGTNKTIQLTITGATTFVFDTLYHGLGTPMELYLTHSDGPWTMTWPSNVDWGTGGPPTGTANQTDRYEFTYNGTMIYGRVVRYPVNSSHGTREVFNVRSFGAKGDGTTDDTAAIQAAFGAKDFFGGGVIYIPVGRYKITGAVNVGTKACEITGDGRSLLSAALVNDPAWTLTNGVTGSVLVCTGPGGLVFDADAVDFSTYKDFALVGPGSAPGTAGLTLADPGPNASILRIDNVLTANFSIGMLVENIEDLVMHHPVVWGNVIGLKLHWTCSTWRFPVQ